MQEIRELGEVSWTYDEIRNTIPDFLEIYKQKPIDDNQGGMKSPHMFATWFLLKKINPKNVIESGVWKGQGTWLIEKTLPDAKIYSIDLNLSKREYLSEKVMYFDTDFFNIDWSIIQEKENTILFFDDHQNAFERIKKCKGLGFKYYLFEDNYPSGPGDCYSLKKAFQHAGFEPDSKERGLSKIIKTLLGKTNRVAPNSKDASYLKRVLEIYYEFPPVFIKKKTRWGDNWDGEIYPTPLPLYEEVEHDYLRVFREEADSYTWLCYAKIR